MDRKIEDRDSERYLTSSEGSAHMTEYTEEDNISVAGSMIDENVPAWHALRASDSDDDITDEDDRRDEKAGGTVPIN